MADACTHPETVHHQIAKEQLLLDIARTARGMSICPTKLGGESLIAETEAAFGVAAIRARLGHAYPHLTPEQDAAVLLVFAKESRTDAASQLGDSPVQHHHHGGSGCSKSGMIHGLIGRIEQKFLAAIGGKRGHRIAAVVLRGGALLFCPGDDIAAIGLQIYGSISGQGEHSHHTEQAILPPKVVSKKTIVRMRIKLRD